MTNPSWGIKRNCPACSTHFYDLNKNPAVCPKCQNQFDPALQVKAKRKVSKRSANEDAKANITPSLMAAKKAVLPKKKDKKSIEDGSDDGANDIAEIEDVDDIENLQELSELEEIEESSVNTDDADDESIIEDMDAGDKSLVENIEDEEAKALGNDLDDEEEDSAVVKKTKKKKSK